MSEKYGVVRCCWWGWREGAEDFTEQLLDAFSLDDAKELIMCDVALTMGKGWRIREAEVDRRVFGNDIVAMYCAFNYAAWKADGAREGSEGAYIDKGSVYVVSELQPQND